MKKMFLTLAVASTMFAACNNDDGIPTTDAMTDTPIALNVGVTEVANRAATELTEGTLGFCMQTANLPTTMSDEAKEKYTAVNRKVNGEGGKWTVEGNPLLWRNATDKVTWQAYSPYSENNVSADGILTVTIPTDQANDGVYDLLYGKGETTGKDSGSGINIGLKHMLSKLIVNIAVGSELSDAEIESVVLNALTTEARFNISNADHLVLPGNFIDYSDEEFNINMIKDDDTTFEAILLPYNPDALGVEITLVGGRKFYYTRGFTEFKEGYVQTLNLKMGRDKVELAESGITVGEWKYENGGNDDFRTE